MSLNYILYDIFRALEYTTLKMTATSNPYNHLLKDIDLGNGKTAKFYDLKALGDEYEKLPFSVR